MKTLKSFAFQKPVIFSLLLILASVLFTEIPLAKYFSFFSDNQYNNYFFGFLQQTFISFALILLLFKFDVLKELGFRNSRNWKVLWIGWPIVMFSLMNGSALFTGELIIDTSKPLLILLYILLYLSTGLFEEILCRGVILTVMLRKCGTSRKGIYLSVIVSSLIFGTAHITNFLSNRSSLIATVTQITFAFFIGVFFAGCFLRNKTIWPVIIFHGIFDIFGSFNEISIGGGLNEGISTITSQEAIFSILVTLPLLVYGLLILRKEASLRVSQNSRIYYN